jgi:hypothetical protein
MAALQYTVNIPSTPLSASTPTVVGFVTAPANQRVRVLGYGLYFDGTLNSAQPVEVKLATPSGSGTFTSGSNAQLQEPELTETIQSTYGVAASAQPTLSASNTYKTFTVHPQLGYEYLAPLGQERIVAGGKTWCISINAPAAVDVRGYVLVEE